MSHSEQRKAFYKLKDTLQTATGERSKRRGFDPDTGELDWVIFEREQMHSAVNTLRARLGFGPVSLDDIRLVELSAAGHIDYIEKFALRCAELVVKD